MTALLEQTGNSFTSRRLVRYGDCDASRNYYTPRAADYAVEAVEEWFLQVLCLSWSELLYQRECALTFRNIDCEFQRPLTAGDMVAERVEIVQFDTGQIRFWVSGEKGEGESCFQTHLTVSFVCKITFTPIPVPPELLQQIKEWQVRCSTVNVGQEESGSRRNTTRPELRHVPSGKTSVPFMYQRRVAFGDCTPSGLVYPPRVYDYLLEATSRWYETILGISWLEQNTRNTGAPFLNVSCDYLQPMSAGQMLSIMVTISRLGRTSLVYAVAGFDEKNTLCFNAQLTVCYCVEVNGLLTPTPFPFELREKIKAYQAACGESG